MPPPSGEVPAAARPGHQHDLQAEGGSARDRPAVERAVPRRHAYELHDMPPLKSLPIAGQQQRLWRSLDELAAPPAASRELGPEPPADDATSRRSVLQLLGASAALATLGGCLKQPDEKILPYTRQPPEVTPGNPLHYATASVIDGRATGLLVTASEGRPTKIEGNQDHPSSRGALGAGGAVAPVRSVAVEGGAAQVAAAGLARLPAGDRLQRPRAARQAGRGAALPDGAQLVAADRPAPPAAARYVSPREVLRVERNPAAADP